MSDPETTETVREAIDHLPDGAVDSELAKALENIEGVEGVRYRTQEPDFTVTKIALITKDKVHGLTIRDDSEWVHLITKEGDPDDVLTPVLDYLVGRP